MRGNRMIFWSLTILFVFVLSLVSPLSVMADDPPPPDDTEETTTEEGEEPAGETEGPTGEEEPASETEEPVGEEESVAEPEEPTGEEELVGETEEPMGEEELVGETEEPMGEEELVGETEEPTGEEAPAAEPEEPVNETEQANSKEEVLSVPAILEAAPEDTKLVVLNENGEALALATEEAVEVLVSGDPQWCPKGVTPSTDAHGECTDNWTSMKDLLFQLNSESGTYKGAGTIYVAYDYNAATSDPTGFVMDYNDYALTDLVFQGGWDFISDSVVGTTTFALDGNLGSFISFQNWGNGGSDPGSLTLLDFVLQDAEGLYISGDTTANVSLNNVTVTDTIDGIIVQTQGKVKADKVNASGNELGGMLVDSQSKVIIKNSSFNDNFGVHSLEYGDKNNGGGHTDSAVGLTIMTTGNITLSGVTASGNSGHGAALNQLIQLNGNSPNAPNVNVYNSVFNNNGSIGYEGWSNYDYGTYGGFDGNFTGGVGLIVNTPGSVTLDGVNADNNTGAGVALGSDLGFNHNGTFYNPALAGLPSEVTVSNSVFEDNGFTGAGYSNYYWNNQSDESEYLSLVPGPGIWVNSTGNITLNNVIANSNAGHGAMLNNGLIIATSQTIEAVRGTPLETPDINVNGGSFSLNGVGDSFYSANYDSMNPEFNYEEEYHGSGLVINTMGNTTLINVSAGGNAAQGVLINEMRKEGIPPLSIAATNHTPIDFGNVSVYCGEFIGNGEWGINVDNANSLTLVDPLMKWNGFGHFYFDGDWEYYYPDPLDACRPEVPPKLQPAIGGAGGACDPQLVTISLPNGDLAIFDNLCGYDSDLEEVLEEELPGDLSEGFTFVSGMEAKVLQGGTSVNPLPAGTSVIPSFQIHDDLADAELTILFWDGDEWVELAGAEVEGFFNAASNRPGIFILVTK